MTRAGRRLHGAVSAIFTGIVFLTGAQPLGAQCQAVTESEKVRRILEVRHEILDLEEIRHQIEVERYVLTMYPGGVVLVSPQQAGTLFGYAVASGNLDPDSIQARIDDLRGMTSVYLNDFILPDLRNRQECFAQLERSAPTGAAPVSPPTASAPAAPGASAIDWPDPMDWNAVRGPVSGIFVAECVGNPNAGYPAVRLTGPFRLELAGDGRVGGSFDDGQRRYAVSGQTGPDGAASGDARSSDPDLYSLRWSVRLHRSGDDLLMSGHTLDLISGARGPYSILVDCKPGYMRQG